MAQEDTKDQGIGRQDTYRSEIEQALNNDTQRIGDVWKKKAEHGENAEQIRAALDLATVGSVHSNLGSINTLLKCERLTRAPQFAAQRARMLRNFARRHDLSPETKAKLQTLADEHERFAENDDANSAEAQKLESAGTALLDQPGIYVYTLPHYMTHPVKQADDGEQSNHRTYLKIGRSGVDVGKRIKQQTTTALPEPIQILRHYVSRERNAGDYQEVERKIHDHLNAADHNQNRKRGAGKEWFLTHLTFVDSTAKLLGLDVDYDHEDPRHQESNQVPS